VIAPTFEALSKQYKNVNFLKCDVDAARDVASRYSVSAMCAPPHLYIYIFDHPFCRPTFIFLKGSDKVDQVRGMDKAYVLHLL
jgi:thiol-disulfide isomerase/thioredoxin